LAYKIAVSINGQQGDSGGSDAQCRVFVRIFTPLVSPPILNLLSHIFAAAVTVIRIIRGLLVK
jgi:hypothetical protein